MPAKNIYKYNNEIKGVSTNGCACPPPYAVEQTLIAFRWSQDPISTQCFLPQALRNPPRLLKAKDPEEKCSCWGLSMHNNLDASVSAFKALEQTFKQARKIFGGYVASGTLTPLHGRVTTPDHNGHFDLHEYQDSMVASAFQPHSKI